MVHATDNNIGRIIRYLKENDIYDNTLIIFTSDNGGLSTQRRVAPTSVYPLRAGKGWLYEGGIRIPQLIKLPNQTEREIISEPVVSYDLFPTIANLLNLSYKVDNIDGVDLSNLFVKKDINRDFIFWHFPHYHGSLWKPGSALRNNDWKLVELHEENKLELYNLKDDLSEVENESQVRQVSGVDTLVSGSAHLALLTQKMKALGDLTQKGRFDLAAIVVADIQATLENFDPLLYFPDLFADYNRVFAENVDQIWEHLDNRGTPRWDAFEAFYKSDLDGFTKL